MNGLTKFMLTIHRILGTVLCIMLFVWFASGLVMINHNRFPRIDANEKVANRDLLSLSELPAMDSLRSQLPQQVTSLTLSRYLGQTAFHGQVDGENVDIPLDPPETLPTMSWAYAEKVAKHWNSAPIMRVDTLHALDKWVPFSRHLPHLPIYKIYFNDPEQHQLYISSHTCEPLQYTTRVSRTWALLGPIPHWIYITSLRQQQQKWVNTVIVLSGIGCIVLIAGLYLGIRDFRLARKRQWISPYKKFWYKWHHIIGLFFGIFCLTFCFSGMISMTRMQDLGIHSRLDMDAAQELRDNAPSPFDYPLDYRKVIQAYPDSVRQLEWGSFGHIPYYVIQTGSQAITIDARSTTEVKPLRLTEGDVLSSLTQVHGKDAAMRIELLDEYDAYYIHKRKLDLPVWKVSVDDADHSRYYVNPANGQYRLINPPSRWRHWMYPTLHSLRYKFLIDRPWLWKIVMWTVMLAGTFVSISGVCLAIRYLIRLLKRLKTKPTR